MTLLQFYRGSAKLKQSYLRVSLDTTHFTSLRPRTICTPLFPGALTSRHSNNNDTKTKVRILISPISQYKFNYKCMYINVFWWNYNKLFQLCKLPFATMITFRFCSDIVAHSTTKPMTYYDGYYEMYYIPQLQMCCMRVSCLLFELCEVVILL